MEKLKKRIDSEVNFLAKYTKIAKIYFDAILITWKTSGKEVLSIFPVLSEKVIRNYLYKKLSVWVTKVHRQMLII